MNHAHGMVHVRRSETSWFSFSSVWVPEVRHRFCAWYRYLYLLSLPAGPQTAVFTIKHSYTVQFKDQLTYYVLRNGSKEMAGSCFPILDCYVFIRAEDIVHMLKAL